MQILNPYGKYQSSSPIDINVNDIAIGFSWDNRFDSSLPGVMATQWAADGTASPISPSRKGTFPIKINDHDDVLYVEYQSGVSGPGEHRVRIDGVDQPLNAVVLDAVACITINNDRDALCNVVSQAGQYELVRVNLKTGVRSVLAPPPAAVRTLGTLWSVYGMDDSGRALGGLTQRNVDGTMSTSLYWLPRDGTTWNATGIDGVVTSPSPFISRSGVVVATVTGFERSQTGVEYSVNTPSNGILQLPPLLSIRTSMPREIRLFGANRSGVIVGDEHASVPTMYNPRTRETTSLANLAPPNYQFQSMRAINDRGVAVGTSRRAVVDEVSPSVTDANIAWSEQVVSSTTPPWTVPQLVGQILFGVAQDGGGVIFVPGQGPVPVPPWTPLLSDERKNIMAGLVVGQLAPLFQDAEMRATVYKMEAELLDKGITALKQLRRKDVY